MPKASSTFKFLFSLYKLILLPGPFIYHSLPFWNWECSTFFHLYLSSHNLWSPTPGLLPTVRPLRACSWTIQKLYFLQAQWQFRRRNSLTTTVQNVWPQLQVACIPRTINWEFEISLAGSLYPSGTISLRTGSFLAASKTSTQGPVMISRPSPLNTLCNHLFQK